MTIPELHEFVRAGQEKAIWIISWISAGAGILAFILAQMILSDFILGPGLRTVFLSLLIGIFVGWLFRHYRGTLYIRRLGIRIRHAWQRRMRPQIIDCAQLWETGMVEDEDTLTPRLRRVIPVEETL